MAAVLLASLAHTGVVNAVGLGKLNVLSQLGQPFSAEIDLINVTRDEFSMLRVSLAPPAAYQAANLPFDPALYALRLTVEQRANGTPYIRATSARSITEPYLHLLVELTSQDGKLQRGYAALLDMQQDVAKPAVAAPAPVAAAPVPVPKAEVILPRAPRSSRARRQPVAPDSTATAVPAPVVPAPAMPATRTPVTPAAAGNNAVAQLESRPVEPAPSEPVKPAPPKSEPEVTAAVKAELPKPLPTEPANVPAPVPKAPAPKQEVAPPAPPQPGIIDKAMNHPVLIGGIALALLALIGMWALGRRKQVPENASPPLAPTIDAESLEGGATIGAAAASQAPIGAAPSMAAAVAAASNEGAPPVATVSNVTDMVDPIDEAKVYLEHGQDQPAEDILRVALSKQPGREDMQMLLLEILAGRGDKDGFNQLAGRLHKLTGGLGGHWKRVMAMGYALDPSYPLYSPADTVAAQGTAGPAASADIVPDSSAPDPDPMTDTIDIPLDLGGTASRDMEETMAHAQADVEPAATAAPESLPDINFEFPAASALPPADVPATGVEATVVKDDSGLDFKMDFASVDTKPEDKPEPATVTAPVESDALEDVQQKIDLARAYREMGDKEAVLELLSEIEREGSAEQQAEAREIRQTLE